MMVYDELLKRLRERSVFLFPHHGESRNCDADLMHEAADAIEELSAKVESLQFFADNISKLPDCNTCLKKNLCEFMPKYGEYCRINCPAWLGAPEPPKEG